jgi:hypothetical protein
MPSLCRPRLLLLDANILLRAVFGQKVRELLEAFEEKVSFYTPDVSRSPKIHSRRLGTPPDRCKCGLGCIGRTCATYRAG